MCVDVVMLGSVLLSLASCITVSALTGTECVDLTKEPSQSRSHSAGPFVSAQAQKHILLRKPAVQHPLPLLLRCTLNVELTGVCCTLWTLHRAELTFGGPRGQQQARLSLLCRLSYACPLGCHAMYSNKQ